MNMRPILGRFVHVHHVQKSLDLSSNIAYTCTTIGKTLTMHSVSLCLNGELLTPANHVQGSLHRFVKSHIAVR